MGLLPILVAVAVGAALGVLRGGRLRAIGRTRIRHPEFLAVAIACSLFVDATDAGPSGTIALVGLVGGVFFAGVNLHLTGMAVITVGIVANLLPIFLNGAMPVRPEALVEAEMVTLDELDRVSLSGARELETADTRLAVLGDTYPVRWTGQVVSLGDLIMVVGLADVVMNLMLQRRRRRLPPSAVRSLAFLGWNEEPDIIELRGPDEIDLRDQEPIDLAEESVPAPDSSSSTASPAHD